MSTDNWMDTFDALPDLSHIREEVREARECLDMWEQRKERTETWILRVGVVIILALLLSGLWMAALYIGIPVIVSIDGLVISLMAAALCLALCFISIVVLHSLVGYTSAWRGFFVWSTVVVLVAAGGVWLMPRLSIGLALRYYVTAGLFSFVSVMGAFAGIIAVTFVSRYVMNTLKYQHCARASVIMALVEVLALAEEADDIWLMLEENRQRLLDDLDGAAARLQYNMSDRHRVGDQETKAWLDDRFARKAAAVRELKKWVLMPYPEIEADFEAVVKQMLIAAAQQQWNDFPEQDPGAMPDTRERLISYTFRGLLLIVPIVLSIVVAGNVPFAIFWAVSIIGPLVDPQFFEKIDASNLLSIFG